MTRIHPSGPKLTAKLKSGSEVVVEKNIKVLSATGTSVINVDTAVGKKFKLLNVTVLFDVAPSTSEDIVISLTAKEGTEYNAVLKTYNPSLDSALSFVFIPEGDLSFEEGDELNISFANSDGREYGLRIVYEEI